MYQTHTYRDISLVPRKLSEIHSRDDVDLTQNVTNLAGTLNLNISLPVIPSPMATIVTQEMCAELDNLGMWSTVHRFQNLESRLAVATNIGFKTPPSISVGVGEEQGVAANMLTIQVDPNPFSQHTVISGIPDNAVIHVYDACGRLINRVTGPVFGAQLQQGVYFLKLEGYAPEKVIKLD